MYGQWRGLTISNGQLLGCQGEQDLRIDADIMWCLTGNELMQTITIYEVVSKNVDILSY